MLNKQRLDLLIVEKGLLQNRNIATSAILQGAILVDGIKITKPGTKINTDSKIDILKWFQLPKYVSRGGYKLEKLITEYGLCVKDQICLDIGSSTGGFSDCLLQNNAKKIFAIDVGYGQLDWKIRSNEKVEVIDKTNIKFLTREKLYTNFDEIASLAVIDLSFISLTKVITSVLNLLSENSTIACLIKPQFECSKELVEKGGIIKKKSTHIKVLNTILENFANEKLYLDYLTYSPIKGAMGNIEFLAVFKWQTSNVAFPNLSHKDFINEIVEKAHNELNV